MFITNGSTRVGPLAFPPITEFGRSLALNSADGTNWSFPMKIRDVMSPDPVCCLPTDSAQQVAKIMCETRCWFNPSSG